MSFKDFAKNPPLGWNSWDCFGAGVTEKELIENANFMHKYLQPSGFEYIVCDIQWYEPNAVGNEYNNFTDLIMDEYGRLLPAANRFPSSGYPKKYYCGIHQKEHFSSEEYNGFKAIADYIHSLGLKFGIHIMRGIPRQAVALNLPIYNSEYTAREIAHPFSVCAWNTDMYGLKNCRGSQDYYDSIISMYASWGVDFIKCDDIAVTEFSKYHDPYSASYEIEMIRKAIDKTKRKIVLSLSPGPARFEDKEHLSQNANMWRLTGDFWDRWDKLKNMFEICRTWWENSSKTTFPDCDMLPIGVLCKGRDYMGKKERRSNFSHDELQTMLTLWSMFSSPLMIGGNLPQLNEFELSLLTNSDLLKTNQSTQKREILEYRPNELFVCTAETSNQAKYIAYFNLTDSQIEVDNNYVKLYDIFKNEIFSKKNISISPHGVRLFNISK